MNVDDIEQKLAQLSDSLIAENIKSWEYVLSKYQRFSEAEYNEWIFPVRDLVQNIANTEQAKLFRAGTSLHSLLISTAERHGLENGESFVTVFIEHNIKPSLIYSSNDIKVIERPLNPEDDWLFILQPFLDRLWNETRGTKI